MDLPVLLSLCVVAIALDVSSSEHMDTLEEVLWIMSSDMTECSRIVPGTESNPEDELILDARLIAEAVDE